ncbi:MAG: hypothetical protein KF774_21065 [Planctomyces sp.]|nr:hypothetical protein [Planctomyces sp.]
MNIKYISTTVLTRTYDSGGRLTQQTFGNSLVESMTHRNDNLPATKSAPGSGSYSFSWEARLRRRPIREEPGEAAVVEQPHKTAESITGALGAWDWTTGGGGFDADDRLIARELSAGGTLLDEAWSLSDAGDQLSGPGGEPQVVERNEHEPCPRSVAVFNFAAEGYHTYFVLARGSRGPPVWVHNTCPIHGNPQWTTPAHGNWMINTSNSMAESGKYQSIYMHSRWTTILPSNASQFTPPIRLPDIAAIHNNSVEAVS